MVRRILLLEPLNGGHRVLHVMALAAGAHRYPGLHLTFLVHPWIRDYLSSLAFPGKDQVDIIGLAESDVAGLAPNSKQPLKSLGVLRAAENVAIQRNIDHIDVRHMDIFLLAAPLFLAGRRRQTWSGMFFSPAIHYGKVYGAALAPRRWLNECVKYAAARALLANPRFRLLHVYDPGYAKRMVSEKERLVPDHPQDIDDEEQPPDIDPNWLDLPHRLLCFGALSLRHGIFELCEALARMDIKQNSVGIVFAGSTTERDRTRFREALGALAVRQPNLQVQYLERYLDDCEINWLFNRCSVVAMPYRNFAGSSSVLYWAARAGRPVVAPEWGLLGHIVVQNGLGAAVNTADPDAIVEGLRQAMSGTMFDKSRLQEFAEGNTASRFAEVYLGNLEAVTRDPGDCAGAQVPGS